MYERGPLDHHLLPEAFMPAQYARIAGKSTDQSPELRMYQAILDDAFACYTMEVWSGRSKRTQSEAETWIFNDDVSATLTFAMVCEALDLNVASVRRRLKHKEVSVLHYRHCAAGYRQKVKGRRVG